MQVHLSRTYIPMVILSLNYTSPPSMVEILLFDSVFHNGVTLVSVSTLKPLLGVIGALPLKPLLGVIGALPLKLQASPIISICI